MRGQIRTGINSGLTAEPPYPSGYTAPEMVTIVEPNHDRDAGFPRLCLRFGHCRAAGASPSRFLDVLSDFYLR